MDTYNMSQHFNTTQSDLLTSPRYNYGNNYELDATLNATFDSATQPSAYISSSIKNEIIDNIVTYFLLVISFFGLLGHILSLIILLRPPFIEKPHSLFCIALGSVDALFLLMQVIGGLIDAISEKDVILMNGFLCKLLIPLAIFFIHIDAWILVGLSIERAIAVFWPLRAKLIITKFRIKIFLAVLFTFFILFDSETSVRFGLVEIENHNRIVINCEPVYSYGLPNHFFVFKDQLSAILTSGIPLMIILFCNMATLIKLALKRLKRAQLGVNPCNSNDTQVNVMLISVTLAFTLLNTPVQVYIVYNIISGEVDLNDSMLKLFVVLHVFSVSLNFYLYFVTSVLFRNGVKELFRCKSNETNLRARPAEQQACGSRDVHVPLRRLRY